MNPLLCSVSNTQENTHTHTHNHTHTHSHTHTHTHTQPHTHTQSHTHTHTHTHVGEVKNQQKVSSDNQSRPGCDGPGCDRAHLLLKHVAYYFNTLAEPDQMNPAVGDNEDHICQPLMPNFLQVHFKLEGLCCSRSLEEEPAPL